MIIFCGLLLFNIWCKVSSVDLSTDIPLVEAVSGHAAHIPCPVPSRLEDDEASLILWYRLDLANPIYTLDVRRRPLGSARHFPAPEMEGRARFDVQSHPPVLVLDPVVREDGADYKCRVDLKRSRTLILHSRLVVIVPPGEPIIMDEHGQHLHDVIGPYDEGSALWFICEVDGGYPAPDVTWWRGSTLLDDSYNATKQDFVRNELVVENISRSDWMAEFTCRASNTNATGPKEATLQLDMNLYPLEIGIVPSEAPLTAGVEHAVTCETRGSRPRAIASWWLDSAPLVVEEPETLSEDGNTTLSVLRLRPGPGDNGRTLTCKAANPALPTLTLETSVTLQVQYLPILKLNFSHPSAVNGSVREGVDVYLECAVTANPRVRNVTWEFEGRVLSTNKALGIVPLNGTLLLQRTGKDHQGRYQCSSANTIGVGYSNDLHLHVEFAPSCKAADPVFYGVSTGETTNLSCDVDSNPSDVTYQWSFARASNGSGEVEDTFNLTSSEVTLHYTPKDEAGFGTFLCWGRNAIGRQKEPCVFKVVPAGPPEPVRDCAVANLTTDYLTVECSPGYNGSLAPTYHLEVYDSAAERLADNVTSTDEPCFHVGGLSSATSYVLVVYASNSKGRSKSMALIALTLASVKKRTAREISAPFSPILGVIIGAVLVILVVSVAIATLLKSRSARDNRKKDTSFCEEKIECDMEKKELEDSQDASGKGPDIIPLSKDQEVFHLEGYLEDVHKAECLQKQDSPPTEFIRLKYMHTVL